MQKEFSTIEKIVLFPFMLMFGISTLLFLPFGLLAVMLKKGLTVIETNQKLRKKNER